MTFQSTKNRESGLNVSTFEKKILWLIKYLVYMSDKKLRNASSIPIWPLF